MIAHPYVTRTDWVDEATRYIERHTERTREQAVDLAEECAGCEENERGANPENWLSPEAAAYLQLRDLDEVTE